MKRESELSPFIISGDRDSLKKKSLNLSSQSDTSTNDKLVARIGHASSLVNESLFYIHGGQGSEEHDTETYGDLLVYDVVQVLTD